MAEIPVFRNLMTTATGDGGLLRVRGLLALGMTGIGGAYLLINEAMPPSAFVALWAAAQGYYFGTRGAS